MSPDTIAELFAEALPDLRSWSAAEVAETLGAPGAVAVVAPEGCALGRAAAGEAELFAMAVWPQARRRGAGARLLAAWERGAAGHGAARLFLEVAEDNIPALALYARAGWAVAGRRRAYYGPGRDALVLAKPLTG